MVLVARNGKCSCKRLGCGGVEDNLRYALRAYNRHLDISAGVLYYKRVLLIDGVADNYAIAVGKLRLQMLLLGRDGNMSLVKKYIARVDDS